MKNLVFLAIVFTTVIAVPVPSPEDTNEIEVLQIPLQANKELDILSLSDNDSKISERNKRTIGILRELFPELSKIVEQKIQMIIPIVLRTLGPILLRSGLGGTGGGNKSPNFNDNDDDDDDDNDNNSVSNGRKVSISLPTFPPDDDDDDEDDEDTNNSTKLYDQTTISTVSDTVSLSTTDKKRDINTLNISENSIENTDKIPTDDGLINPELSPTERSTQATSTDHTTSYSVQNNTNNSQLHSVSVNGDNSIDMTLLSQKLESINRVVRNAAAQGENNDSNKNIISNSVEPVDSSASDSQKSQSKAPAIDELSLENEETDDNRNKRFLSFGFGGSNGGSGGGSGNFLFDIIRRTADRAARAAGTVYRVVAGTESLDINSNEDTNSSQKQSETQHEIIQDTRDSTTSTITDGLNDGLVSGSSGTEQSDEKENAPDGEAPKAVDGYTEAIPGPVTRLFVLANRGLSNLIQDLILRIAATSERVVNFKARLITSLI